MDGGRLAQLAHARVRPGRASPPVSRAGGRYDLRHSAASLWLHEGRSVIEVAQWLGHAPTMTLDQPTRT
jgi:integrase